MKQRGVELKGVYITQQPTEGKVTLQITLQIMCDTELEAIGWLVDKLVDE